MRNVKTLIITTAFLMAFVFCLCGCGGAPMAKAYRDLSTLVEQGGAQVETAPYADVVDNPLLLKYNEETDALSIKMDSTADLDAIFDILYKDLNGKDIGTIVFSMSGTRGDGFEEKLDKKIAALECTSIGRFGLDSFIMECESHSWTKLLEKTNAFYCMQAPSAMSDYSKDELKSLDSITDVESSYSDSLYFSGFTLFKNMEKLTFVETGTYYIEEPDEEEATSEEITRPMNDDEEEAEEVVVEPLEFEYSNYDNRMITSFADMKNLKQLIIFPNTGYNGDTSAQEFIAAMKYIVPDLQMNKPNEVYSEESMAAVKDIDTPDITDDRKAEIIEGLYYKEVPDILAKCKKFKKGDGKAKINGNVIVFESQPDEEYWSSERKFGETGECYIGEVEKLGLDVPKKINDCQTFVYVYPTYTRTGVYTSGTGAYSKNLHVQIFDMENEVVYESESVGTAAAPQSFSYYEGSMPNKYSGEVDIQKAFDYLKKLK